MAKKIIGMLQPFDTKQIIYVYEDNNKIDVVEATIDNFATVVSNLANKYGISDINLTGGPKQYIKKIGDQIKEEGLTNYSNNQIEIKYL